MSPRLSSSCRWLALVAGLLLLAPPAAAEALVTFPAVSAARDPYALVLARACADARRVVAAAPRISEGVTAPAASGFDSRAYAAAIEFARSGGLETARDRLGKLLATVAPLGSVCDRVESGAALDATDWLSLRHVAARPRLDVAASVFEQFAGQQRLNRDMVVQAVAAAMGGTAPDFPLPATAPAPATRPPESPLAADLSAARAALLRGVLGDVLGEVCSEQIAGIVPRTCQALRDLGGAASLQGLSESLKRAAKDDLRALSERQLLAGTLDENRATAIVIAAYVSEVAGGRPLEDVTVGLSALQCGPALAPHCGAGTILKMRQVGTVLAAVRHQSTADPRRRQYLAIAAVLSVHQTDALRVDVDNTQGLESLRRLTLWLLEAWPAVAGTNAGVALPMVTMASGTLSQAHAGVAQAIALLESDPAEGAPRLLEALAALGAPIPSPAAEWITVLGALGRADGDEAAAAALLSAPGVAARLAQAAVPPKEEEPGHDPFLAAPKGRPDDAHRKKPPLARYLAGLRAAYVFQYWKPADIPDVAYRTTGLNLARFELLTASDAIPLLEYFQGYLKYEFAPGGSTDQERLIELTERELSGWQALVADLGANLPFLGGDDAFRGPVFGFKRRAFLATAQALKDYWFYDTSGVTLLVPGDSVRTNTIMTTLQLGFRSTQMSGKHPTSQLEAGAYYLDYRKPYSHDRLTEVDRAALYEASFVGGGGYLEARWFPETDEALPLTLGANVKFGPAEIQLDRVAASEVLPSDAGIWMVEARAFVDLPALWFGGFFLGGHGEVLVRDFGDYFGGADPDPAHANAETLNRDLVVGLSAQAGYFF